MQGLLEIYKSKSLKELKLINPKWAYGTNYREVIDPALKGKDKQYVVHMVKTALLIEKSSFADVEIDSLYNGYEKNDIRITKILSRWENNEFVDPPTIYLTSARDSNVSYRDGQHRAKLSYFLGFETIPVGIHKSDIIRIKTIIDI